MREQRKVVTILFADVVGSTEMADRADPEVVRATMARYFKRISELAEAYGGTVEKFAGDSAMVVFGVPTVHDDDAERAVRAAIEIRDGASEIAVRVGVNTGEAVTAARDDRQFMVSGDAVNVAARLQQGADPGEVLVGPLTQTLTRTVIEYEPHEPVAAKGKSDPLVAFLALRPRSSVPAQARGVPGLRAPLVGRGRELRLLLDTFERTAEDRRVHLFTLVGAAGVGKSRLVAEALAALTTTGAGVVRGRCLPYGRGITYWPMIEILQQETQIALRDDRDAAVAKLDRRLMEMLAGDPQLPAVRARLAVMMGFDTPIAVMPDTPAERVEREIAWALRHYLEAVARSAPLIVVVDDLQWAEPAVTEMLEQLVDRSGDVPLMIIAIARPDFLEGRPGWGSGKANATTITLDPLSPTDTGALISHLLEIDAIPGPLRAQIIDRSAGTPLFCEEFVRMLIDEGRLVREGDAWKAHGSMESIKVPHTIQAVLGARLDSLPDAEKQLMQAASVIGERFEPRAVRDMMSGVDLESGLQSLRRRGLVTGGDGPDEEVRFRHLLVRDAAYASLPKSERAALHDRFGLVLEAEAGDPQQMAEILAHHAERALTLTNELAIEGEPLIRRARRALEWSVATGDRAATRRDGPTVDAALGTALEATHALPDGGGPGLQARLAMLQAQALLMSADYAGAAAAAARASGLAEQAGLVQVVARARLAEAWIANWRVLTSLEEFDRIVERAVEACRAAGDVAGEIEAKHIGTNHLYSIGRLKESIEANEALLVQARALRDSARTAAILLRLTNSEMLRFNVSAADAYLAEAEALAAEGGLRNVALQAHSPRGTKLMFAGDLAGAEAVYREYVADAREAGAIQQQVAALRFLTYILLPQGRPLEAAEVLEQAILLSESSGERWNRTELFALRAQASLDMSDLVSAQAFIDRAAEVVTEDDVTATSEFFHHRGLLRAAQGRASEAEADLRGSVAALAGTDYEWAKTESSLALAAFLAARGRAAEAGALLAEREALLKAHDLQMWDGRIGELRAVLAAAG